LYFINLPCMLVWGMVRACSFSLIRFPKASARYKIFTKQILSYFGFILIVCDFMTVLKVRLYQASFNSSHSCRGGTTKSSYKNKIFVPLPSSIIVTKIKIILFMVAVILVAFLLTSLLIEHFKRLIKYLYYSV
jgi:hypothetical protein